MHALAYLCSRYPATSHTFVRDEIAGLRARGFSVVVASINRPDRSATEGTAAERDEAARTFVVKAAGARRVLAAHLRTLTRRPLAYFGGLLAALHRAGLDGRRLLFGLFYFGEAVLVGDWMARAGARHLHVHFANPASTVGSLVRRIFPVTFSLTTHGSPPFHDEPGTWFAATARSADFLCCISRFARAQVWLRLPPEHWDKVEITPMGIDASRFSPPPAGRVRGSRPFEILAVGRLVPVKGYPVLLDAVASLCRNGRDMRLRLVGDGPERARLESRALQPDLAGHVVFDGALSHDQLPAAYAAADAFALPSFHEGVPVVLMEAMASGCACVASGVAGVPELVRDGLDGLLVPPADPGALAAALARLAGDVALRERLGASARERVLSLHEHAFTSARIAEVFARRLAALHAVDRNRVAAHSSSAH